MFHIIFWMVFGPYPIPRWLCMLANVFRMVEDKGESCFYHPLHSAWMVLCNLITIPMVYVFAIANGIILEI